MVSQDKHEMKPLILSLALTLISGCTTVPIGTVALCVGFCRVQIEAMHPQSSAEKIGGGLAGLLAESFKGNSK
jgi:starvation-inducible outer membrane lipoprotein